MTKEGEEGLAGQRGLKKAIVVFAVVEALVMAAVVLFKFFRH
ncbi:MAG: hypothetical protein ABR554_04730 [Pyrinomonadaceae bacterium]